MVETTPDSIQEARRYLANAKQILREKARKEDGYFQDSKYVKMAGHTAYAGILLVLDEVFGKKTKGRKDVDWYKSNLSQADKKMLNSFMTAYQVLHLDMAYDGARSAALAKLGIEEAEKLIHWVERKTGSA
ncbi:hypothetical protein DYBT9623_03387 [Dyadobacter sp. CECT 9623]|uniref:DUF5618 domain-containing protein n=1 Tax=Dyadobacter linearis TaxID=2823330 RepID=A0ABM8USY8_9BACT|nr:DUF5618 family protein [Dyadobacter sp. CECT 9623]CAG5071294.1 hypothetical protein DYBT9623_03387 [Dyadobacter sp. CECT 9623]